MPKRHLSYSDVEETSENSSAESEDARKPINGGKNPAGAVSEYEKQRLSRIAENRARMEALGLPKIASSLMGSGPNAKKKKEQKKGKAKVLEDDEDYRPDEDHEGPSSSGSREEEAMEEDDDDDFVTVKTKSGSRGKKNKSSKSKKVLSRSTLSNDDCIDDDEALKHAISLSLQGSDVKNADVTGRKGNPQIQEDTGRRKRKNSFASRLQMTEDELILHFFQFDEKCDGGISIADIQRLATTHDFMWNKEELADMIHCFDSDGDGKLSLEEFRKIVVRCNMIKEPEQS
ncbi:hypothetical protein ACFX13_028383 [Malus domestica]|uniref:uncharacterized protein isoform X1 n=1 Tax=Malus domestica TaxID=3750 RepID=UPI00049883B6|nr:uncharacterized protein LOC103419660 isoform X1 [Malus domestica]XP_050111802.1 uncharacterized protein LOC126590374 isoform X1 [Malus sylvestris]